MIGCNRHYTGLQTHLKSGSDQMRCKHFMSSTVIGYKAVLLRNVILEEVYYASNSWSHRLSMYLAGWQNYNMNGSQFVMISGRKCKLWYWSLFLCCRLLTHMLWDYRCEKWWRMLTNILTLALKCAYLSANIQDYVVLSLEALGTSSLLLPVEKTRIFNNVMKVLKVSSDFWV